jgi:hypothetical protein
MTVSRSSILFVTTLLGSVTAINNGLAITPPMGWVRSLNTTSDLPLMGEEQLERFRVRCLRRPSPHNLFTNLELRITRFGLQLCCTG